MELGTRVTVTSSAGVGARGDSRQPRELGAGLERVRGAAGLGSRRKSGGVGQTGAPSWGAGQVLCQGLSMQRGSSEALESAPSPRPRCLPHSRAQGRGPLGSQAPGGMLRPRSPRAQTTPGAAHGAGGISPVLHLEAAGRGRCLSPSEAAGCRLKTEPKETEVDPSVREEAPVRCGTGPGSLGGQPGAGEGSPSLGSQQQMGHGTATRAQTPTPTSPAGPEPEPSHLLRGEANVPRD